MTAHFLAAVLCLATGEVLRAADFYVARTGNDSNPGTLEAPWRTIQKAADTLAPGDTAFIRGGIYRERVKVRVSGAGPEAYVTLRSFPGEIATLDGSTLVPPRGRDSALLTIADRSYVRVQGLELRNYAATAGNVAIAGIFVTGAGEHIELRENRVHHIRYRSRTGNAFGIAIYGTSAAQPLRRVIVDGNDLHHLRTGNSECLSLNGNVTDFEVTNNLVHDNDNIGIVFIGFEGTCPDPALDQARDGLCRGNNVWNISSYGNPAYGQEYSAGGIYVDGGARVLIERNRCFRNDIGVELASEHAQRTTSGIVLRNNWIYRNRIGGIFLGGYDRRRGGTDGCAITHNTLFENDTKRFGNGELYLQHFVTNNRIGHNLFVAGAQGLLLGNPTTSNTGNVLNDNLYFSPGVARWQWQKQTRSGFAAYQALSAQDPRSLFAEPLLASVAPPDFHLTADSPAIDRGDPAFAPAPGETDFDGGPRQNGPRVDLGADEFQSEAAPAPVSPAGFAR